LVALTKGTINRRTRSKKRDITCKKATDLIIDYLDGELDPDINSAFEEHLSDCPDCVAFLNTYKKTVQIFKSLYRNISSKKMNKGIQKTIKEKIKGNG
jgi:anti-sigma factor RsiW